MLRDGLLEKKVIEVDVPAKGPEKNGVPLDGNNPSTMFASEFFKSMKNGSKKSEKRKMLVSEARPLIEESECEKLLEEHDITKDAIASVEQDGIVFIDEIDKLISSGDYRGADASSEGVQRDLLPLIEGSTISTKHGNVNTDFILFIASGTASVIECTSGER
jgi:ATP-dependent HslUV protease ATP-binding subunit HslU